MSCGGTPNSVVTPATSRFLPLIVSTMVMCWFTNWLKSLSPLDTSTCMPCAAAVTASVPITSSASTPALARTPHPPNPPPPRLPPRRRHGQRAAPAVAPHAGDGQHRPAQQAPRLVGRRDLRAQVLGHRRAPGLVFGVNAVAEGRAGGIENAGRVVGRPLLAQRLQHVDHAADGAGGGAARIARNHPQIGQGMEGAVEVAGSIYQHQGLGIGHARIVHLGRPSGMGHGRAPYNPCPCAPFIIFFACRDWPAASPWPRRCPIPGRPRATASSAANASGSKTPAAGSTNCAWAARPESFRCSPRSAPCPATKCSRPMAHCAAPAAKAAPKPPPPPASGTY